jgi:hypothetical protein
LLGLSGSFSQPPEKQHLYVDGCTHAAHWGIVTRAAELG